MVDRGAAALSAEIVRIDQLRRGRELRVLERQRELAELERSQRLARYLGDDWDGPTPPRAA